MNFTKATLSALTIASAFLMGNAQASVITGTYAVDVKVTQGAPDTFTFILADYVAGMTFTSASFSVRLTDSSSTEAGAVTVGKQSVSFTDVTNSTVGLPAPAGTLIPITLNAASLADLAADGQISITISSTTGDFHFADATLTANAVSPNAVSPAAVPEPMSLGLLGIGFLGLGAARRRKAAK